MFFLKCLDDQSELDGLIKREIEKREWFLLCDSVNSRESTWVQREIEVISENPKNFFVRIELDASLERQLEQAASLTTRATVYIAYHRNDEAAATEISRVLREHDFAVWVYKESLRLNTLWAKEVIDGIAEAAKSGFILLLVNEDSLRSELVNQEMFLAMNKSGNIIPINLTSPVPQLTEEMQYCLARSSFVDFSRGSIRANAEKLVAELKRRPMK